ncbi:MAG: thiazole biosynthesis adenylyltransferase ThiF [Polyangiales bacterium]
MTATQPQKTPARANARVAIVGLGGLGCPAALALSHAGVGTLRLIDDDQVDRSNLHRQILYRDQDVGRRKVDAAADALMRATPSVKIELRADRLHPGTVALLEGVDVIVECSDNYATKFLTADAARLLHCPVVHGAAIRWIGTAFAVSTVGAPCFRCLFEDMPKGAQGGCDVSGVVGPICGIIGAIQAQFALDIIDPNTPSPCGTLVSLDGLKSDEGALRYRAVPRRNQCPLCGVHITIDAIDSSRYMERPSSSAFTTS